MRPSQKIVITSKLNGDEIIYRATWFMGALAWVPDAGKFIARPLSDAQMEQIAELEPPKR